LTLASVFRHCHHIQVVQAGFDVPAIHPTERLHHYSGGGRPECKMNQREMDFLLPATIISQTHYYFKELLTY